MFCEISGPLSHAAYRKIHGPSFQLRYLGTLTKGPKFVKKRSRISKKKTFGDLIKISLAVWYSVFECMSTQIRINVDMVEFEVHHIVNYFNIKSMWKIVGKGATKM